MHRERGSSIKPEPAGLSWNPCQGEVSAAQDVLHDQDREKVSVRDCRKVTGELSKQLHSMKVAVSAQRVKDQAQRVKDQERRRK